MNGEATLCKHCHQPIEGYSFPAWMFLGWRHVTTGNVSCDLTATPEGSL